MTLGDGLALAQASALSLRLAVTRDSQAGHGRAVAAGRAPGPETRAAVAARDSTAAAAGPSHPCRALAAEGRRALPLPASPGRPRAGRARRQRQRPGPEASDPGRPGPK